MSGPNQGEEWLDLVLDRVKKLPDTEDYFDKAFQIAGEIALTMRITLSQMDEFYEMLIDMDNEAQIRRIGRTLDYGDTKTELLAGAEMYSDLEKKHKSCAVRISDFKRRLQSAVDKTSGLE
ncbi:hypothetical protein BGZ59_005005 [Podila verticillata]|nr:hypothetical protein BGZ59_005005 [Podila verticillata]